MSILIICNNVIQCCAVLILCEGSNNNIVDKKLFDLCRVMLVLSVGCVIVRTRDHHHSLLRPETISPH